VGRRATIACIAATAWLAAWPGAAQGSPASLAGARSFAFAIGSGMLRGGVGAVGERFAPFDVVVVDGEEATRADVAAIARHGTVVLGYLSVGTIERWRSWYPLLRAYRLNPDRDWSGEWFADASRRGFRRALLRRIAPRLLAKGFDGLFLDNVDMVETRNHRAQRPGMRHLVRRLAALVHGEGGLLFAQNGAWALRRLRLARLLDGWNREDVTFTYDFARHRYARVRPGAHREAMRELRRMRRRFGLLTTATDYTARARGRAARAAIASACAAGALPYVSDIGLTLRRLPDPPLACP